MPTKNLRISKSQLQSRLLGDSFLEFARAVHPGLEMTEFHENYYKLLDLFAQGRMKRLLISVPPQHGKSLGASTLLPAYLLGKDPDLKVCVGSYSFSLARTFGGAVRRVIGGTLYRQIFPRSYLKGMSGQPKTEQNSARTAEQLDMVGANGGLRLVGRQGALTGCRVDVMILDDLYKDAMEANSPVIRDAAWQWYTSVVRTRLHNDSQEIVVFTRWHEDDVIGRIMESEKVVDLEDFAQLESLPEGAWVRVNFQAIKQSAPTAVDPREAGQPLWPERHSLALLREKQKLDSVVFEALYQGNPVAKEGLLYGPFATYDALPNQNQIIKIASYTDTADMGQDKLCSVVYVVDNERKVYLVDVLYTDEPMGVTELAVAEMLDRNRVRVALIESNNGGRGFARSVARNCSSGCVVKCFHQANSKQSRVLTNSSTVNAMILMPRGWQALWPGFAAEITNFRRFFAANKHDDAVDTLTGIVEAEFAAKSHRIQHVGFTG